LPGLSCAGLAAVLHDDDVLYLWLFRDGEVQDHEILNSGAGLQANGLKALGCERHDSEYPVLLQNYRSRAGFGLSPSQP
jgi:hypothetical protein